MRNNSLGHIGLNHLPIEVEQDSTIVGWNDPSVKKQRESNPKHISEIDPVILDIEKKDISIATRVHNAHISDLTPMEVFGKKSCPQCKKVKVKMVNGCACVEPVFPKSHLAGESILQKTVPQREKRNRLKVERTKGKI